MNRIATGQKSLGASPRLYGRLATLLRKNPKALRHHWVGEEDDQDKRRLVLTADTAELQKFIVKNLETAEAWKDPFDLTRDVSGKTTVK